MGFNKILRSFILWVPQSCSITFSIMFFCNNNFTFKLFFSLEYNWKTKVSFCCILTRSSNDQLNNTENKPFNNTTLVRLLPLRSIVLDVSVYWPKHSRCSHYYYLSYNLAVVKTNCNVLEFIFYYIHTITKFSNTCPVKKKLGI